MRSNRISTHSTTQFDGRIHSHKQTQSSSHSTTTIKAGEASFSRQKGLLASTTTTNPQQSTCNTYSDLGNHTKVRRKSAISQSHILLNTNSQSNSNQVGIPIDNTLQNTNDEDDKKNAGKRRFSVRSKIDDMDSLNMPIIQETSSSSPPSLRGLTRQPIQYPSNFQDQQGFIKSIRYSKSRNMMVAIVDYGHGNVAILPAVKGMKVGGTTNCSRLHIDIRPGNATTIRNIPIGTIISFVEMSVSSHSKLSVVSGSYAQVISKEDSGRSQYAVLRLATGEFRVVNLGCMATIGAVAIPHFKLNNPSIQSFNSIQSYLLSTKGGKSSLLAQPARHPHVLSSFKNTRLGAYLNTMFSSRGGNINGKKSIFQLLPVAY